MRVFFSTGFGWGNFLHRNLYGFMFWFYDQNTVGYMGMFLLLLGSAFHCTDTLSVSNTAPLAQVVCKKWEGDTGGQLTKRLFHAV